MHQLPIILTLWLLLGHSPMTQASDHFDGSHYVNTDPQARDVKGLVDVLKWKFAGQSQVWPVWIENTAQPEIQTSVAVGDAYVTMINHATTLIQLHDFNVLTDPVYAQRCSPVAFAGPKRVRPPGVPLERLPPIDVVLISHNHYDHLEVATVAALQKRHQPTFIVPLGNGALLRAHGAKKVVELDWWQSHKLDGDREVVLAEAQHWSARGVFDRNRALWAAAVVRAGGVSVYFAGDTGYSPHFVRTRDRLGAVDVALLPIGAYEPRWFMRTQHMNPDDAVRAHLDLGARQSMGIHFNTFQLTDESIDDPVRKLDAALCAHNVPGAQFVAPANGETLHFRK